MKVVMISRGFEDYIIGLLNSLSKIVELYYVVPRSDEWVVEHLDKDVNIIYSNAPRVSNLNNILCVLKLVMRLRKIQPDIVHMQSGVIWELLLFLVIRSKFVTTIHDVTKHPTGSKMKYIPQGILDLPFKLSDAIIVHGESLKIQAKKIFEHKNIYSIDHGIISRYGTGKPKAFAKTQNILFFGTIDKWKGVEYLVKAVPIVFKELPDASLKVAGRPSNKEYYASLLDGLNNVESLLYRQSDSEVESLFSWADILVLPYIEASQSGVLQLGISYGLPVVVTNVGGLPDVIRNEVTGLIVEAENQEELANAIIRLLVDIELRERIIKNICIERDSRFSWNTIADKTHRLYQELI